MKPAMSGFLMVPYRSNFRRTVPALGMMAVVVLGCGRISEEDPFLDHSGLDPLLLEGSLVSASPAIGEPVGLRFSEDKLWVLDFMADPGLHVLEAESGALLFSTGRRGEGPGEFERRPSSFHIAPGDENAVWAYDFYLKRFTRFEARPPSDYEPTVVTLQAGESVRRTAWMGTGEIVAVAHSEETRFQFFSPEGEFLRSKPGDLLGPETASHDQRLEATDEGIIVQDWPERGFVIAQMGCGRIEFYDMGADLVRLARVPFPSDPVFEPNDAGELRYIRPRQAYLDVATNRDYLFALFSGRLLSKYERYVESASAEFVHVFDWSGELHAVYRLDRDVRAISVTPSGEALYAASLPDASVYRYDLPPIPGGEGTPAPGPLPRGDMEE